jgi:hypothetical protein
MKLRVIDILFWIFFILAIIFFFWYLFGGSPTFEQSLLALVISSIIKLYDKIGELSSEIKALAARLDEHLRKYKKK